MERLSRKKRFIAERLIPIAEADDDFDLKFWQRAGVQMRFSAAWKMLGEFYNIRGRIGGYKLRLQRSIQNIKQA